MSKDKDFFKYLAKEIKVLLVDQYGDEKIVKIPVTWDYEWVDSVYGFKPTVTGANEKVLTKEEAENYAEIKNNDAEEVDSEIAEITPLAYEKIKNAKIYLFQNHCFLHNNSASSL